MARRGRNSLEGKPPKCENCGSGEPHVVLRVPGDPGQGHAWLCGSCELERAEPWQAKGSMPGLPSTKAGRLQKEKLFDV